MRRQRQHDWDQQDYELEREFEDITNLVQTHKPAVPNVPFQLDRSIRRRSRLQAGGDLQINWIFGSGLQLAMAVSLLFVVSIMFIVSLEQQALNDVNTRLNVDDASTTADQAKNETVAADSLSDHSWVRLSFTVSNSGQVQNISVLERCYKADSGSSCADIRDIDKFAIQQIRSRRYTRTGPMEKIVFVTPAKR